jgi:uncharacterized integral membrane protein
MPLLQIEFASIVSSAGASAHHPTGVIPFHPAAPDHRRMAKERRVDRSRSRSSREQTRMIGAFLLGALAVLFAVLNFDEVGVNWIVATWQTPLIVVIVISALVGAGIGWTMARRRSR